MIDYAGVMEDLYAMAARAANVADELCRRNRLEESIPFNVFYRECFEFYKDIEDGAIPSRSKG